MFDSLVSLATLGVLLLAAYGLGAPLVRALKLDERDGLSNVVWGCALGFVAAATAITGLGLAGWLYLPLIGILTSSACFLGLGEIVRRWLASRSSPHSRGAGTLDSQFPAAAAQTSGPPAWLLLGMAALCIASCLGTLVSALAPSTDGDALCYHLDLPKIFLAQHSLAALDYNDHATFPLLVEMLYLWALALDSCVAAQLVHYAFGILLALASVLLASGLVGRRWAWLAGSVVLLVPGMTNQMTAALNDLGLVLFTTLALVAWRRAVCEDGGPRWFVAVGLMLGAACGTKYTAWLFVAALGGVWLWSLCRQHQRRRFLLQGAAIAAVVTASVAGTWYVRAAWQRGNPVYPFFSEHLGQRGPDVLPERKTPHGWDLAGLASLPWELTMHPERFGGRGHQLGAMFLLALPGLALARRLRGLETLLAVCLLYFLLWYELRQNVRFLYPLVPLLSVGVVWFWMELRRWPLAPRWLAAGLLAGVAGFGAVVPLVRCPDKLQVALGLETREAYLLRQEPSYAAAQAANALLGPGDRLLSQDYRTFYFSNHAVRESVFRRQTHYDKSLEQPAGLTVLLREFGFTHLLLADAQGDGIRYNQRLARLVEAQEAAGGAEPAPLLEYRFHDSDGALRHYRLLRLR